MSYDWGDGHAEGPMEAVYLKDLSYSEKTGTIKMFNVSLFITSVQLQLYEPLGPLDLYRSKFEIVFSIIRYLRLANYIKLN